MSLLVIDGCESEGLISNNSNQQYTETAYGTITTTSAQKRSGSYSKLLQNHSQNGTYSTDTYARGTVYQSQSYSTIIVGFGMRLESSDQNWSGKFPAATKPLIKFGSWNYNGINIGFNSSSQLVAYNSVTGATIGTTTEQLHGNTQYYIQMKLYCHSSNGSFILKIGNSTQIDVTNINTLVTNNYPNCLQFCVNHAITAYTTYLYVDDIYVCNSLGSLNNDFLGICSVYGNLPNADGDVTDFSASSGDRYTCVDEHTTNTGDYVYTDQTDKKILFNIGDTTVNGTILGIKTFAQCARSDAGSGITKYKFLYRDKYDNEQLSSIQSLNTSTQYIYNVITEINPISGIAQTNSDIAEMQWGILSTVIE